MRPPKLDLKYSEGWRGLGILLNTCIFSDTLERSRAEPGIDEVFGDTQCSDIGSRVSQLVCTTISVYATILYCCDVKSNYDSQHYNGELCHSIWMVMK